MRGLGVRAGCGGREGGQGMRGVAGGARGKSALPAPARHLGACVGLAQLARGRWGRVSALAKKRASSFGRAVSPGFSGFGSFPWKAKLLYKVVERSLNNTDFSV